ncbi:MAG: alkaline phosphatase [Methyloprofundus sp.]|nr:alkaline phosphatase [Methyloprofundus sp.]
MNLKNALTCLLVINLLSCSTLPHKSNATAAIKNVILVIGDGMGPQQVGLLLAYARQAPHSIIKNRSTAFDRLMQNGQLSISLTHSADTLVTDSAASATQLATGHLARPEMIGIDQYGNAQENIISKAKRLGKATGLVSDTRITHATPAAFAAHQAHRSMESEIAADLLQAEPDIMLSAGLSYWLPESVNHTAYQPHFNGLAKNLKSKRHDQKDLLSAAKNKGYTLAFNKQQLQQAQGKTLGLFADTSMVNGISEAQQQDNSLRQQPTLQEMTQQALSILEKNDQGFFLMVEAGQIDWAGHQNDTGLLLHEMLRINATLNTLLDWLKGREDTLLIVTADHETGGFGFSYSAGKLADPIYLPGDAFANKHSFQAQFSFGSPTILDRLYQQKLSYNDIFKLFDGLPKQRQTSTELVSIINSNSEFPITEQQAQTILSIEENPLYIADHKYLGSHKVPKMVVNSAFFPYQSDNRANLLAQAVAIQQQSVWSTGTHTSTPVYAFIQGPELALQPFKKILHHTDLGNLAIQALKP